MLIIKNFAWIEFLPSPFHPPICLLECFKIVSSIVNFQESWFKLVTMVTSIVGVAKSQSTNENFLVVKGWVQIFLLFFCRWGFCHDFQFSSFFSLFILFSLYTRWGWFLYVLCIVLWCCTIKFLNQNGDDGRNMSLERFKSFTRFMIFIQ